MYTDEIVRMSSSLLASLGVRLGEEDLYSQLLAAVKDKRLGRDVVTNQFVSDLSDRTDGKRTFGLSGHTLPSDDSKTGFPHSGILGRSGQVPLRGFHHQTTGNWRSAEKSPQAAFLILCVSCMVVSCGSCGGVTLVEEQPSS